MVVDTPFGLPKTSGKAERKPVENGGIARRKLTTSQMMDHSGSERFLTARHALPPTEFGENSRDMRG